MSSPWIFLTPLAAPLFFVSPAQAQTIGPCCQPAGQSDIEDPPYFLVRANTRRPTEHALTANAEAPVAAARHVTMHTPIYETPEPETVEAVTVPLVPIEGFSDSGRGLVSAARGALIADGTVGASASSCCQPLAREPDAQAAPQFFVSADSAPVIESTLFETLEAPQASETASVPGLPPARPIVVAEGALAQPQDVGIDVAPCCTSPGAPDPNPDYRPVVRAQVDRPNERAFEAVAEAPVPVDAALAEAARVPLEVPAQAPGPAREPVRALVGQARPLEVERDGLPQFDSFPGCCQIVQSSRRPRRRRANEREVRPPPVPVAVDARRRDERTLVAAVELPIPTEAPRVNAIGVWVEKDEDRPGVSEPVHVPAVVESPSVRRRVHNHVQLGWSHGLQANAKVGMAIIVLLVLGIGLPAARRRKPMLDREARPPTPPLPVELRIPDALPVPPCEPIIIRLESYRVGELEDA
jgi:hypothetical protein